MYPRWELLCHALRYFLNQLRAPKAQFPPSSAYIPRFYGYRTVSAVHHYNRISFSSLHRRDVSLELPIVFICTDSDNNYYICDCLEDRFESQEWIIAPISVKDMESVIHSKKSVRAIFQESGQITVAKYIFDTGEFTQRTGTVFDLPDDMLPEDAVIHFVEEDAKKHFDEFITNRVFPSS